MTILMNLRMKARTLLIVYLFMLLSCQRESDVESRPNEEFSFFAMFESLPEGSKTVVQEEPHVYWEPGDEIIVFAGTKSSGRFTNTLSDPASSATFSGSFDDGYIPVDGEDLWALYPYSDNAMCNMYSHAITTTIPSEQVARANSFGKDMNITVAHSTSRSFTFYNVGGGVRFSLAKAGVTKVVLKSLGGESIAGRITINTSGEKPSVSSISTGYSSITLLPPEGETFETDTWYYFVAIPGTLSDGYSLYYCTNENSGKYFSNESVTIKRSVFGSLEHVDTRAEIAGPSKPFPTTKEEWEASISLASSIAGTIDDYFHWDGFYDGCFDTKVFINSIGKIDGVSKVYTIGNGESIVVEQQDGLHFNVPFKYFEEIRSTSGINSNSVQTKSDNIKEQSSISENNTSIITPSNEQKKALLLMPFYEDPYRRWSITVDYRKISSLLKTVGYELDCFFNESASYEMWMPDKLSEYDLILFATHGGVNWVDSDGGKRRSVELSTCIPAMGEIRGSYDSLSDWNKIKLCVIQGHLYSAVSNYRYSKYESRNNKTTEFNKSIVCAMACHSIDYSDFAQYFLSRNCSAYLGVKNTIHVWDMDRALVRFVECLTNGASVGVAEDLVYNSLTTSLFLSTGIVSSDKERNVYLIDTTPTNLNASINESGDFVTLSWEIPNNTGTYRYNVYYGDGTLIKEGITSTQTSFYLDTPGNYEWYVKSILYDDNVPIVEHQSITSSFTSDFSDFVDLGLSVKWGRCNLGAENSAEVGNLYAWGETSTKTEFTRANYLWQEKGVYNKYGAEDGYVLELGDDAANVVLGDGARMPTPDEFRELINPNNCDVTWDRIKGITIVSKIEGYEGITLHLPRTDYWTSVLSSLGSAENAYYFRGDAEPLRIPEFGDDRYKGHYIRPVKSK